MELPQSPYERGTATLLNLIRKLCRFARRYDYERLLEFATGNSQMGAAVRALILACDAFLILDSSPGEKGIGE